MVCAHVYVQVQAALTEVGRSMEKAAAAVERSNADAAGEISEISDPTEYACT